MKKRLSLLIESEDLMNHLDDDHLLIVDLSMMSSYKSGHVPGAIPLGYPEVLYQHEVVDCDIPPDQMLSKVFSRIGLTRERHVVAYDGQSNPMACRLIWTLEEIGFPSFSLLNGGLKAWVEKGLPVEQTINNPKSSTFRATRTGKLVATKDYIISKLGDPNTVLLDTRMEEEYTNELIMTDRGGYIPGAVHYDWENSLDKDNHDCLQSEEKILEVLYNLGVTKDKEIIVYCQTHSRSAHTCVVLKWLGYPWVRGYAAGYSEWGNDPHTPITNDVTEELDEAV